MSSDHKATGRRPTKKKVIGAVRDGGSDKRIEVGNATRNRILDVAELLFADYGFDAVSVRRIAEEAGVDLALINYHFGSKEGLYQAVFEHRAAPINDARISQLEAISQAASSPSAEDLLGLLVEGLLSQTLSSLAARDGRFTRLLVRELLDPRQEQRHIVQQTIDKVALSYLRELRKALPHVQEAALHYAYHLAVGAVVYVLIDRGRMDRLSNGALSADRQVDFQEIATAFVTGGMRAVAALDKKQKKGSRG